MGIRLPPPPPFLLGNRALGLLPNSSLPYGGAFHAIYGGAIGAVVGGLLWGLLGYMVYRKKNAPPNEIIPDDTTT